MTDFRNKIMCGNAIEILRQLPDECVQMCVTSPPYWGLRQYAGTQEKVWGGMNDCDHEWGNGHNISKKYVQGNPEYSRPHREKKDFIAETNFCQRCGAWKGALGLEPTPKLYVDHIVAIFREVKRVLRDDGTLWLNMGDSYNTTSGVSRADEQWYRKGCDGGATDKKEINHTILKPKDLVGMPWRVAFALQADGWYLRSDIIWEKITPMPESVTDRPTKAHEYLFLLSKNQYYYYDANAIREPHQQTSLDRMKYDFNSKVCANHKLASLHPTAEPRACHPLGRNKRTVWRIGSYSDWEYCDACGVIFSGKARSAIKVEKKMVNDIKKRILHCPCGATDDWLSHFATFPPDLVDPCILAGSSPTACGKCGSPWERVAKPTKEYQEMLDSKKGKWHPETERELEKGAASAWGPARHGVVSRITTTLTFQPTCECEPPDDPGKSIVLDPFMGSGTTAIVAANNGRDYIGIDLSEEYCAMARKRIAQETAQLRLSLTT